MRREEIDKNRGRRAVRVYRVERKEFEERQEDQPLKRKGIHGFPPPLNLPLSLFYSVFSYIFIILVCPRLIQSFLHVFPHPPCLLVHNLLWRSKPSFVLRSTHNNNPLPLPPPPILNRNPENAFADGIIEGLLAVRRVVDAMSVAMRLRRHVRTVRGWDSTAMGLKVV